MWLSLTSFESYYLTPREDIVSLLPPGIERALDVGCGGGKTGVLLKELGVREVVGIEKNEDAARYAKDFCDRVIVGDVERIDLPFPPSYFDLIIYADVLEHLFDPWSLLRRHRVVLREGGFIVVSIPNIRYYKVLKRLILQGRWDYKDRGILDFTHIRFFTYKTAIELIENAGFEIQKVKMKISGSTLLKFLNKLILGSISHFLVRQYLILAKKVSLCQESRSSSQIITERA